MSTQLNFCLIIYLFCTTVLFAQKNEFRLNVGYRYSSSWVIETPYKIKCDNCYYDVEDVQPLLNSYISISYARKITDKTLIGLGINQNKKGLKQSGTYYDISNTNNTITKPFELDYKREFWAFFIVIQRILVKKGNWNVRFEYNFIHELNADKYPELSNIHRCHSISLNFERRLLKHLYISLNPNLETAFFRYHNPIQSATSSNYDENFAFKPYAYGLNLGLKYVPFSDDNN